MWFLFAFSELFLVIFVSVDLGRFSRCFLWGNHEWVPSDPFLGDCSLRNPSNRSRFDELGMNSCSWWRFCWFAITHDWEHLGPRFLRNNLLVGSSYLPKSFSSIRWVNGRSIGWKFVFEPQALIFCVYQMTRHTTRWSGCIDFPVQVIFSFLS